MSHTTSVQVPESVLLWISRNPYERPARTLFEDVLLGHVSPTGYDVKDASRNYPVAKRDYNIEGFPSMKAKLLSGLLVDRPIADGLSAPELCIVSLFHWCKTPQDLAALLRKASARRSVNEQRSDEGPLDWLSRCEADPRRWYKLIFSPSSRGRPVVESILYETEAVGIESTYYDRFYLVSVPAFHACALYPGLPVEALV